jgi:CRP-like cAMP-binding protein
MSESFFRQIRRFGTLSEADEFALNKSVIDQRTLAPGRGVYSHRSPAEYIAVIIEGFAARYFLHPHGQRQVEAFLLPGDCSDLDPTDQFLLEAVWMR